MSSKDFDEADWKRVAKGDPSGRGGEFSERQQAAADPSAFPIDSLEVPDDLPVQFRGHAERALALANGDLAPTTSYRRTVGDVRIADDMRDEWWLTQTVSAGYAPIDLDTPSEENHPTLEDDYTPSRLDGRPLPGHSELGNRRLPRMLYGGSGMAIRMPSVSATRRFARLGDPERGIDPPVTTQWIPLTAEYTDPDGRTSSVTGRVLATKHTDNDSSWYVEAEHLDVQPPEHAEAYAEAVNALLEARGVRMALPRIADFTSAAAERRESAGVELSPVASGWIDAAGQVGDAFVIKTKPTKNRPDGGLYGQAAPPSESAAVLRGEESAGGLYNRLRYHGGQPRATAECATCHKIYLAHKQHKCTGHTAAPATATIAARRARERAADRLLRRALNMGWLQENPNPA